MLTHLNSKPILPKRVVILGAGGFVGSALTQYLEEKKITYLGVSRKEIDLSKKHATPFLSDLITKEDVVINLAVTMGNNKITSKALIENLKMTENIGSAIKLKKCQHLIHFSSDAIYPFSVKTISEKSLPAPFNLYGIMHLAREHILKELSTTLSIPLTLIRPTQIYGINTNHNAYGPTKMCRTAIEFKKIQLVGLGEELRDFISIEDTIQLLTLIIQYKSVGLINFATGCSLSFKKLATQIMKIATFPIELETVPRKLEIWHRQFDNSELKKAFPFFKFSKLTKNLKKFLRKNTAEKCYH